MDLHGRSLPESGLEEYERLLTLLDQRRFDEALVRGQVMLEQPETVALARAKCHNLLCWIFVEGLKRPAPEAVLHGEESVRLAERLNEKGLQVQALCNLASAYYQVADYDAAERCYQQVMAMLLESPALLSYGRVLALQGMAQIDLVRGEPGLSLKKLEEAESLCLDDESRALLAEIHRRKAMALLRLGRAHHAAEALAKVDETTLTAGPRGLWWRTHLGITRSRVEIALGRWAAARGIAVNTVAVARELGDMPVLAECACLLATIEAAEGRTKEVHRRARAALTYAIQSGRRDVVEDVRDRMKDYLHNEL
ncbi:MAG: hypothetical protein ACOY94_05015 [Bacillota bacterium]